MFKKMLVTVISVLMVFILGACGNNNPQVGKNTGTDSLTENGAKPVSEIAIDSETNILITHFSWSGNTKQLADMI